MGEHDDADAGLGDTLGGRPLHLERLLTEADAVAGGGAEVEARRARAWRARRARWRSGRASRRCADRRGARGRWRSAAARRWRSRCRRHRCTPRGAGSRRPGRPRRRARRRAGCAGSRRPGPVTGHDESATISTSITSATRRLTSTSASMLSSRFSSGGVGVRAHGAEAVAAISRAARSARSIVSATLVRWRDGLHRLDRAVQVAGLVDHELGEERLVEVGVGLDRRRQQHVAGRDRRSRRRPARRRGRRRR